MATPPLSPATAEFGERVRQARHRLGDSQEKLAERAGLHWSFVGQVERGRRNVSLHNILKLAQALGVDPAVLVQGITPPPDEPSASGRRAEGARGAI